jgi:cytochrome P450
MWNSGEATFPFPCLPHLKMNSILLGLLLTGTALSLLIIAACVIIIPPSHPRGIPAVPFWVTLIPFFKDVDQAETLRKYIDKPIRTHGAVKLFFAARWNILICRPQYLAEIFKHEDIYQKSGNQKKIPHSVLAEFLGDNIISAHGTTWRQYRQVIKPGLQRKFEVELLSQNARKLCNLLHDASIEAVGEHGAIAVQELLQRYTIANLAQVVLQTDFGARITLPQTRQGQAHRKPYPAS